jgi:hypothetical protein
VVVIITTLGIVSAAIVTTDTPDPAVAGLLACAAGEIVESPDAATAGAVCVPAGPVTTAAALAGGELAGAGAEVPRNTTYDAPAVSPALRSAASSAVRKVDC